MGAKSKIEWTDATWNPRLPSAARVSCLAKISDAVGLVMNLIVTGFAQRNAVAYVMAMFRVIRPRFDVMSIQIAAALISTMLASVIVTNINSSAPRNIFRRQATIGTRRANATFPARVCFSTWSRLLGCFADSFSLLYGAGFARSVLIATSNSAHLLASRLAVLSTFESWRRRCLWISNTQARKARGLATIAACRVFAEIVNRLPSLTLDAPLPCRCPVCSDTCQS